MRDLRAELLAAEAAHQAKLHGGAPKAAGGSSEAEASVSGAKRALEDAPAHTNGDGDGDDEDPEAKRRRILEESRDIDADDSEAGDEDSEESSEEDSEDEDAELLRELEKIKRERAEKREKEVRAFSSDVPAFL